MKNRHLPNWIIWITEQIPKYMLQICLVFSFNTLKFAWKLINTVLAAQGLIIFYKKSPCIIKMLIKMSLYKEGRGGGGRGGGGCQVFLFRMSSRPYMLHFSNFH